MTKIGDFVRFTRSAPPLRIHDRVEHTMFAGVVTGTADGGDDNDISGVFVNSEIGERFVWIEELTDVTHVFMDIPIRLPIAAALISMPTPERRAFLTAAVERLHELDIANVRDLGMLTTVDDAIGVSHRKISTSMDDEKVVLRDKLRAAEEIIDVILGKRIESAAGKRIMLYGRDGRNIRIEVWPRSAERSAGMSFTVFSRSGKAKKPVIIANHSAIRMMLGTVVRLNPDFAIIAAEHVKQLSRDAEATYPVKPDGAPEPTTYTYQTGPAVVAPDPESGTLISMTWPEAPFAPYVIPMNAETEQKLDGSGGGVPD